MFFLYHRNVLFLNFKLSVIVSFQFCFIAYSGIEQKKTLEYCFIKLKFFGWFWQQLFPKMKFILLPAIQYILKLFSFACLCTVVFVVVLQKMCSFLQDSYKLKEILVYDLEQQKKIIFFFSFKNKAIFLTLKTLN